MIPRLVQPKVAQLLEEFPAVALLGPRQVGKTTLALSLTEALGESALYLDLELPSDRAKLSDPELYLNQHEDRLVILDEIHRVPASLIPCEVSLTDDGAREIEAVTSFCLDQLPWTCCSSQPRPWRDALPTRS